MVTVTPRLRAALTEQSQKLMHCAYADIAHEVGVRAAEELVTIAPAGLTRVFFSDDGSTAVEAALKMALQFQQLRGETERTRFVSLHSAFHGDTAAAMSISGVSAFRAAYGPILFDALRPRSESEMSEESSSASRAIDEQAVAKLEALLATAGQSIAALVVEPLVQGAAGMRIYPKELLDRLAVAARSAGVLLVVDEVFTGFGRTGRMWACDYLQAQPDILCSAKGLSGGVLPFAATLATEEVFQAFRGRQNALMHGHTFFGNPLGAAISREVMAIYREEGIVASLEPRMRELRAARERLAEHDGVHRARTLGMILACDLGEQGYHGERGRIAAQLARQHGVYMRPLGDTVYIAPSLNIPLDVLCELTRVFELSATEAAQRS